MKNIRRAVFETNSSSTHSISISNSSEGILETLGVDANGHIVLGTGEYGWEWESFNSASDKADYCAIMVKSLLLEEEEKMLTEVIKEHTGAKEVIFDVCGYIDHQSLERDTLKDAFKSKESLKNFIFNKNSYLFTGNDNSSAPPNFYDLPNKKYKYKLTMPGYFREAKLEELPDLHNPSEEFVDLIYSILEEKYDDYRFVTLDGYGGRTSLNSLEFLSDNYIVLYDFSTVHNPKFEIKVHSTKQVHFNILPL